MSSFLLGSCAPDDARTRLYSFRKDLSLLVQSVIRGWNDRYIA